MWKLDPNDSQVETLLQKGDEECPLSASVPPRVVPCGAPDSQKACRRLEVSAGSILWPDNSVMAYEIWTPKQRPDWHKRCTKCLFKTKVSLIKITKRCPAKGRPGNARAKTHTNEAKTRTQAQSSKAQGTKQNTRRKEQISHKNAN